MPKSEDIQAKPATVSCVKCGSSNPARRNLCQQCGSHLYVQCPDCNSGNPRSNRSCENCGHPLHRSFLRRLRKKLRNSRKFRLAEVALLLAGTFIGFKVIVYFIQLVESPVPPQ